MTLLTRRALLISGGLAGGGLALGLLLTPARLAIRGREAATGIALTTWVRIAADGTITVLVPHAEMGQGVHTALPMMLAEELDAAWSQVRVEQAPAEGIYAAGELVRGFVVPEGAVPSLLERHVDYATYRLARLMDMQITGGSASVRFSGRYGMRRAGAAARDMLVRAAAEEWQVPAAECETREGRVLHRASGRMANYGELASRAAGFAPDWSVPLKPRERYSICGKPMRRLDTPAVVTGRVIYGIDTILPGMKYAAIRHSPVFGGEIISMDQAAIAGMPGGCRSLKLPGAVAVIADGYWQAKNALDRLPVEFDDGGNGDFSSDRLSQRFDELLQRSEPETDFETGSGRMPPADAAVFEAIYEVPFLAHAPMEPINCTAWFHDDRLEVWAGVQDLLGARAAAARAAELDLDHVTAHPVQVGGGFGRRLPSAFNYVEETARIAMQVSHPVKLIWSREEDLQHDYYRPAVKSRFRAALDGQGRPSWWMNVYTDIGMNDDVSAAFIPYAIPDQFVGRVVERTPVPLGFWRSVEHSYQGFFVESFVDEICRHAGADPLEMRLHLLRHMPRHRAVLLRAAEMIGWGRETHRGRGYGIALKESFGSVVAEAVHAAISPDGTLQVLGVAAAVDAGEIINPDIARAQVEGGIIFGLSAAVYGRIRIENGRVEQSNFPNYELVRLADAPYIEVEFIDSGAPIGGMGEVGVPPVAAALCNAIVSAGGPRIRRLPILDQQRRLPI